jgi:hypothetical protein
MREADDMRAGLTLLMGLAVLATACGRAATGGPAPAPEPASYQTLVASASDAEGNAVTQRFDSMGARAQATAVPTNASDARFTATGAVSYLLPDSIHTLGLAGGDRTDATSPARVIDAFSWSDNGALAYVAHSSAPSWGSRLVIRPTAGATSAVALPPAVGGPTPSLRFSPDGRLLLLVDAALAAGGAAQGTLQVRRLDGSLLFQASAASEATWAGSRRVYFADPRGVNVADLTTGTTRTILPGARWRAPDTSPDGRTIVFELPGERGVPRLELLDTSTDAVLPGFERDGGTAPRFVSPTEVWFHDMGGDGIVCLDIERRTETPTGLTGIVTDVRQLPVR